MSTIKISAFGGMVPRTGDRLLPDNGANYASNLKLQSGELRPINRMARVHDTHGAIPRSIYRARNMLFDAAWLTWEEDVDVVSAPFSAEVESRLCWTGDGEPRIAKYSQAVSGDGAFPNQFFALGIPSPTEKPVVNVSGGASDYVTRFYCTTFFSADGEESGSSPISTSVTGRVDGSFLISGMGLFPVSSGTVSATVSGGVTIFDNESAHWLRAGDQIMVDETIVTVSSVPDPTTFAVPGTWSSVTAWERVAPWNTEGMKRRLYRTTGTSGSWQLVAEDVPVFYEDTLTDAEILGDELISEGWNPPPAGLKGLCLHSSGSMCGFVGNKIYMSEPMQPHAWLDDYVLSTDYTIVGMAAFGSSVLAATEGNPFVATGVDPTTMSGEHLTGTYPCLSKRSVTAISDGAMFSSSQGLIAITQSGISILTDAFYTSDEWLLLNPYSMFCEYTNGRVYCGYEASSGERGILVFNGAFHDIVEIAAVDLYADQSSGLLYVGTDAGIMEFDPEYTYPMVAKWRSKDFVLSAPVNLGAAKIDFKYAINPVTLAAMIAERNAILAANDVLRTAGRFGGGYATVTFAGRVINGSESTPVPDDPPSNELTFTMRNEDAILFTRTVRDKKAFRLPSGIKYDCVSFEVSGCSTVLEIRAAETMDGLRVV